MNARKFLAGLSATAVVASGMALSAVAPASADPAFTPDASTDVVGVGSDTIEFVVQALADGATVGGTFVPGYNQGKSSARLVSWNATGPETAGSWVSRSGAAPTTRPNGSGKGKSALYGSGNLPEVNFARSSSAISTAEAAAGLWAYPFAVDGLKMAVSGKVASHAPASLTLDTIFKIYNGTYKHWNEIPGNAAGSANAIHPLVPQTGSGTRGFFEGQLTIAKGSAWAQSDYAGASTGYPGVVNTQEHSPADVQNDPDAIAPFSTARFQTLATPGAVALEQGWSAQRAVYNVVRQADKDASSWVGSIFGSDGFICSSAAKSIIEANGFAQLAGPGAGGVCGVATQSATSNLQANTVTTTTTLAATSPAGRAVHLVATIASNGAAADGDVDFFENGTNVGSGLLTGGQAVLDLSGVTPGSHTYTASFTAANPASFTDSSSAPATVTVKGISTTALTIAPAATTYGHARSAQVSVSDQGVPATGTVTVKVGTTTLPAATLTNGAATVAIPASLGAGSRVVSATWAGDADTAASSASRTLVIGRSATVGSEGFAATVARGKRARGTVKVALAPASALKPTGAVLVKKGAKVIGRGNLANGALTLTLPKLARGRNTLVLVYGGNANALATSKTFTIVQR